MVDAATAEVAEEPVMDEQQREQRPVEAATGAGAASQPGMVEASSLVSLYPGAGTNPIPPGVFQSAVAAFKIAYNIGINLGDTSGPYGDGPSTTQGYLQHNGNYDQATADAVNLTLGPGSAPAAWTSATPQQNNNPPQNNTVVASTGWPMWLKIVLWIIALGGAVGLGLWLYKTFGSSNPAMAGESKKTKTGKRSAKKK